MSVRGDRLMWTGITILVVMIIVIAVAGYQTFAPYGGFVDQPPISERITLAVLPFENLGPVEDEALADGIAEVIAERLAELEGPEVIPHTIAAQYKNTQKSATVIGEELGVRYVLVATIQRGSSGHVLFRAQLMNVALSTAVWSGVYDVDMTTGIQAQNDIAAELVAALAPTVVESMRKPPSDRPTDDR